MALFGGDYDTGYHPSGWAERGRWGMGGRPMRPEYEGFGWQGRPVGRWGAGRPASWDYGEDYRPRGFGRGFEGDYDHPYKSRWQTDYGDPFGDRVRQTPMRVIRGPASGNDRSLWSNDYDRDFGASRYPMRGGRYGGQGFRSGFGRGSYRELGNTRYDRGWY